MTATILVVDDESDIEELVRQKFKRKIRKQFARGYRHATSKEPI